MYNSEIYVEKYYTANIRGLLTYPAWRRFHVLQASTSYLREALSSQQG